MVLVEVIAEALLIGASTNSTVVVAVVVSVIVNVATVPVVNYF